MAGLFGKRPAVKQRPAASPYSAVVDTAGMDPEMKSTVGGMRGPGSSAAASDPFTGVRQALASAKRIVFGSHGKQK